MFIPSKKNSVLWPVVYRTPKDGGGFEEHPFKADYKLLSQARIDTLFARAQAAARGDLSRAEAEQLDTELLQETFLGWTDVKNEDGSKFEVTSENKETLLQMPGMRAMLVAGFFEIINGAAERKNSKPPRSTG